VLRDKAYKARRNPHFGQAGKSQQFVYLNKVSETPDFKVF
jgi:hypothetical protein